MKQYFKDLWNLTNTPSLEEVQLKHSEEYLPISRAEVIEVVNSSVIRFQGGIGLEFLGDLDVVGLFWLTRLFMYI